MRTVRRLMMRDPVHTNKYSDLSFMPLFGITPRIRIDPQLCYHYSLMSIIP